MSADVGDGLVWQQGVKSRLVKSGFRLFQFEISVQKGRLVIPMQHRLLVLLVVVCCAPSGCGRVHAFRSNSQLVRRMVGALQD